MSEADLKRLRSEMLAQAKLEASVQRRDRKLSRQLDRLHRILSVLRFEKRDDSAIRKLLWGVQDKRAALTYL